MENLCISKANPLQHLALGRRQQQEGVTEVKHTRLPLLVVQRTRWMLPSKWSFVDISYHIFLEPELSRTKEDTPPVIAPTQVSGEMHDGDSRVKSSESVLSRSTLHRSRLSSCCHMFETGSVWFCVDSRLGGTKSILLRPRFDAIINCTKMHNILRTQHIALGRLMRDCTHSQ